MTPTSSRINPFDHGARLVLAAALMLIYAVISIGIRFLGRWPKDLREFYPEDALLIAAAVTSVGYTASICVAVSHNFGQHENQISPSGISSLQKALLASCLLFHMTKGLANVSYGIFLHSLSKHRERRITVKAVCGVTAILSLVGVIASAVAIAMNEPISKITWIVIATIEAVALVILFLLNAWMIQTAQLSVTRKLTTTLWFSFVLGLIAVIIVRLTYTPANLFRPNFTFNTIDFFIILTVETFLAIINAAYPNLLVFVSKTSTGFMNTAPGVNSGVHSGTRIANRTVSSNRPALKLRNDEHSRITTVAHGNHDNISLDSFSSQAIMVSTSVTMDGGRRYPPGSRSSLTVWVKRPEVKAVQDVY